MQWAGAIEYVTGEAKTALTRELHRELERTLTKGSPEYVNRVADYKIRMTLRYVQHRFERAARTFMDARDAARKS